MFSHLPGDLAIIGRTSSCQDGHISYILMSRAYHIPFANGKRLAQ